MVQSARTPDVSMEEILASIRRIISDEDSGRPVEPAKPPPGASPGQPAQAAAKEVPPRPVAPSPARNDQQHNARPAIASASPPNVVTFPATDAETEHCSSQAAPLPAPDPPLPAGRAVNREATQPEQSALNNNHAHDVPDRSIGDGTARERGLLSRSAAAAVNAEFTALTNAVSADWDPRLEELARRMLRPMLRAWLDRRLPALVRRMVREEIERISRGR
jgi:cell pole-organizing protein PopZ